MGEMLKRYRLAAGLTQEALAERAGISPRSVQAIESGTNLPYRGTLRRLSAALDISETERDALAMTAQRLLQRSSGAAPMDRADTRQTRHAVTTSLPGLAPLAPTPLLGRESELARLAALLCSAETRLATLTGPGGVGKTRLALAVGATLAPAFADGVAFVDLTPLTDPGLLLPTVATALSIVAVDGQPLQTSLVRALEGKHRLLILDNCEQVVAAAPAMAALVAQCPALRVLATSRRPLRVRGECVVALAPLPVPPASQAEDPATLGGFAAVALFVQQAQTACPGLTLSAENAAAVAEICRRLDGLPLALELAAARAGVLPPRALVERLAGTPQRTGLSLLTGGARDLPVRQQTMRDTIAWSYALLTPQEQTMFRGLSIFSGGCMLWAAEQVCCEDEDDGDGPVTPAALDTLGALVENSLLRMVEQSDGQPRYMMLETIREYGCERLVAAGEADALLQRHAAYYLDLAEEARLHLHRAEQIVWLARLDQEIDNLRAAFRWCVVQGRAGSQAATERGLWAVACLFRYWVLRTHHREGRDWLAQLLALPGAGAPSVARARALRVAGVLEARTVDLKRGRALCEESIALCRALGERRELGHGLLNLARMDTLWPRGHVSLNASIRSALEEVVTLYAQTGYDGGIGGALILLSYADLQDGVLTRAEEHATRGLALVQEAGDRLYAAYACEALAEVARLRGDLGRARELLEQRLALDQALEHWSNAWGTLAMLGELAQELGDGATAQACYVEALKGFRETGDMRIGVRALAGLSLLAAEAGDLARGLRLAPATTARTTARNTIVPPATQARLATIRVRGEQALGADEAEAIWQVGSRMTLEQTFAVAFGSRAEAGSTTS
jgi:predicted ATPase/transcriptional regulator with XRE-family HTH domain